MMLFGEEVVMKLVQEKVEPAVRQRYPMGNAVWQDDGTHLHRCPVASEAVEDSF